MSGSDDLEHADLLMKVMAGASKMPAMERNALQAFIGAYYRRASLPELLARDPMDLYGAAYSHWQLVKKRAPRECLIEIHNPQFEQHGWQSNHTIIAIAEDNKPFLVDSIKSELNRLGLSVRLMLYTAGFVLDKDADGQVTGIQYHSQSKGKDQPKQSTAIFVEISQIQESEFADVKASLARVLTDVRCCVDDWQIMRAKVDEVLESMIHHPSVISESEYLEVRDFLEWIRQDNFTFIGYYELQITQNKQGKALISVEGTGLGVLRDKKPTINYQFNSTPSTVEQAMIGPESLIILSKTSTVSSVHRPVYTDCISVKKYDEAGQVIGHHKFIGLYTSAAYNRRPHHIPILRVKVGHLLKKADVALDGHDGKELYNILENLPRDDLIQASEAILYDWSMGILQLHERLRVRLFARQDALGGYFSCLVYVPREKFNSELRVRMGEVLKRGFSGTEVSFSTQFTESVLARIHYVVRLERGVKTIIPDIQAIEDELAAESLTWDEGLQHSLWDNYGEDAGEKLFKKYKHVFPAGYREDFVPRNAMYDIAHLESLTGDNPLAMSFYRPLEDACQTMRFKLFQPDHPIPLSEVVPMLENFGLAVMNERPYGMKKESNQTIWLNDFCMRYDDQCDFKIDDVREAFQDAFYHVWLKDAEDDGFNRLILSAGLNWRQICMLRAYAKYLWQTGFTFTQSYVEQSLYESPEIARQLAELFDMRFNPDRERPTDKELKDYYKAINVSLESVESLDQDRILRRFRDVIKATLRTNFYQLNQEGLPKNYISLKFNPKAIPDLPRPLPMFEIFVYAPWVEGVHLRTAQVARGGLRWSDRREDFRTEVLGLMKAQRVKNSVIVPMGAKGGFCPKRLPINGTRDEILKEGIFCYQTFIRGLLDVTDNLKGDDVIAPNRVIRYDADDTYLVVAADKGTATFSDIANGISKDYDFWLGDAFASGGTVGYDHKKMGITARGAWESVKRHFREMGIDSQSKDFTVMGIGDMAGDVFGNGMLLSEHIRLLGAFNHMHIFIDPNPDAQTSFKERERLFNLPRSQWTDYDPSLISEGGGVFSRKAKSIRLTPQMKALFGLEEDLIEPNALIQIMINADVDLLWNGGIGTYVKSAKEHNSDVGDRANDYLRVNGSDLRAKVVGEGGNLGFTQLGRVEYALNGGRINTDAIDNSAGVDCSDHEVNIKILLNTLVMNGDLTEKQRNLVLSEMTEEVGQLCLANNRSQSEAISVALFQSSTNLQMQSRLISELESSANLDRGLEFLPSLEDLAAREAIEAGLTRPELAVMMAYTKIYLKEQLLASDIPEEPYVLPYLESGFPKLLREKYHDAMCAHRLRREIISTQLSNAIVNEMGINFVHRLIDETGAVPSDIIRAYLVTRQVFDVMGLRAQINGLNFQVDSTWQDQMLYEVNRLSRRGTRWFLRHRERLLNIEQTIAKFQPAVFQVTQSLPSVLSGAAHEMMEGDVADYTSNGIPKDLAIRVGAFSALFSALDVVNATINHDLPIARFMSIYYSIGHKLHISWFKEQIKQHVVKNHWDALARSTFRDALDSKQCEFAILVMQKEIDHTVSVEASIDEWLLSCEQTAIRWQKMIDELRQTPVKDYTMFSVALRELMELGRI